jgi:hypothetical protein
LIVAAALVLSAALINPVDSAAQRQRSPGGNGGGRQQENRGGRERQRENGEGPQRENGAGRRENGGGRQRDDGAARPQDGGGRAEVRAAQPRQDRGDAGTDGGRRESPSDVRESTPPPQVRSAPGPDTRSEAASSQGDRQIRRRFPTAAERADATGSNVIRDGGNRGTVTRDGGGVRSIDRSPNGSRVAVPRTREPYYRDGNYPRGYSVYRNYGGRNIYVVPRGRTYYYYPRYYYTPYSFGYGPGGRGPFYFDLYYNSYVWHPYSVYRYGTYGTYGYPVGELRLKVHPRDAQVFIDGSYAGRVDEFDGVFQSLRLEEGEYQVEIVLPGYEPLAFDVRIFPGEKTTYEGDLIPE